MSSHPSAHVIRQRVQESIALKQALLADDQTAPLVEIAIKQSPLKASDSTCRLNTSSNE